MAITPNSDVILLKCPLELSQDNQLSFSSKTAQYNYFHGLSKYVAGTNFTYQRKDGIIRIPAKFDDLIEYNYVMYRNDNYSNKWFYAFIDKMEYVNDGMTAVSISTDVFQTWQFDLTYKKTFVEREHVNDDTIGKHTIPEGLDLGEFEIVDQVNIPMWETSHPSRDWLPCFCVTRFPAGESGLVEGRVKDDAGYIGGVFSSLKFFAVSTLTAAQKIIDAYDSDSATTSGAIVNIYMIPACCVNINWDTGNIGTTGHTPSSINGYGLYPVFNYAETDSSDTPDGHSTFRIQQSTTLAENYTPVNKKLYTYPFSYVYMSNNVGEDVELKWEDFGLETISGVNMPTINYKKVYVPSASVSAKLVFTRYKTYTGGTAYATGMYNYGLNFGKVPICAWQTDYYTNWLTQNGVNVQTSLATSVLTMGAGIAMGVATGGVGLLATAGTMISGASSIASTLGEMHKAETTPPQAHGNVNTGDLIYAMKRNSISCYKMSIRKEMAQVIDSYFSMYGYKVNSVKIPNVSGRTNWNFVKTINCYIQADIPQEDLAIIKTMFDRGLTIWHNANTFMDYSQSNTIMS